MSSEPGKKSLATTHLQQTLTVFCRPWRDDLQARDLSVPGSVVLRVLGRDTSGRAVRPTENDRTGDITTGHVVRLARRVDNLVNGLHSEVESHEFTATQWASIHPVITSLSLAAPTLVASQQAQLPLQYQQNPFR